VGQVLGLGRWEVTLDDLGEGVHRAELWRSSHREADTSLIALNQLAVVTQPASPHVDSVQIVLGHHRQCGETVTVIQHLQCRHPIVGRKLHQSFRTLFGRHAMQLAHLFIVKLHDCGSTTL